MTLREEFESATADTKDGISFLFEVRNSQYIEWLENKISKLRQDIGTLPSKSKKGDYCAVCGCEEFWNDEEE